MPDISPAPIRRPVGVSTMALAAMTPQGPVDLVITVVVCDDGTVWSLIPDPSSAPKVIGNNAQQLKWVQNGPALPDSLAARR